MVTGTKHNAYSTKEKETHMILSERFSPAALRDEDPKLIQEIFKLYYPKLNNALPGWMTDKNAVMDPEGIASEAILNVVVNLKKYSDFKELDISIHSTHQSLYKKVKNEIYTIQYKSGSSLDSPVSSEVKTDRHGIIADKNAISPLDILILSSEIDEINEKEKQEDLLQTKREEQKQKISDAAKKVLNPLYLKIYNLRYVYNSSYEDIARILNKTNQRVWNTSVAIRQQITRAIREPEWNGPAKKIKRSTHEFKTTDQIKQENLQIRNLFAEGTHITEIQKQFPLSIDSLYRIVQGAKNFDEICESRKNAKEKQREIIKKEAREEFQSQKDHKIQRYEEARKYYAEGMKAEKIADKLGFENASVVHNLIHRSKNKDELIKARNKALKEIQENKANSQQDNIGKRDLHAKELLSESESGLNDIKSREIMARFFFQETRKQIMHEFNIDNDTLNLEIQQNNARIKSLEIIQKVVKSEDNCKRFYSVVGRSTGLFCKTPNHKNRFFDLIDIANKQGHLPEVYQGMLETSKTLTEQDSFATKTFVSFSEEILERFPLSKENKFQSLLQYRQSA